MARREGTVVLAVCLAALGGCNGGSSSGGDPAGTLLKRVPGGDGPADGPAIASVRFPPDAAGDIAMDVAIT
jgi:hypothetical protein